MRGLCGFCVLENVRYVERVERVAEKKRIKNKLKIIKKTIDTGESLGYFVYSQITV